jgi:hypothetical protein
MWQRIQFWFTITTLFLPFFKSQVLFQEITSLPTSLHREFLDKLVISGSFNYFTNFLFLAFPGVRELLGLSV